MSSKYNIDSSHSEKHSMDVLRFADENYQSQLKQYPYLEKQVNVIYTASILHDMCDKKYMKQEQGIQEIEDFLRYSFKPEELHYTTQIIETMSYSTVKKNGYPDLGMYQQAYHIVREADLLASYDFDRSIIYHMNKGNTLTASYDNSLKLFNERMFNYNRDKLLLSEYALQKSLPLQGIAVKQMLSWNRILHKTQFK
jgi:HD superfamily phosphodiesterase